MSNESISAFIARAQTDGEFLTMLLGYGDDIVALSRVATEAGYPMTSEELLVYVNQQLETKLSPADKQAHAEYVARRARGEIPGSQRSEAYSQLSVDRLDAKTGFFLDRAAIYSGRLVIGSGCVQFEHLWGLLRGHFEAAMAPWSPIEAHLHVGADDHVQRVTSAAAAIRADAEIGRATRELLIAFGLDPRSSRFTWPGCRVVLAARTGDIDRGFYQSSRTQQLGEHRDTWLGYPLHQINLWAPLYAAPREAYLRVLPRYFTRSLPNTSSGHSVFRSLIGLSLHPVSLETPSESEDYTAELMPGEFLCFSGHQLHRSGRNPGPNARISVEIRFVDDRDREAGLAAVNVDSDPEGEIVFGWTQAAQDPSS
jgi:hypothetical protein